MHCITNKGLVRGLREATLLIQQREKPHRFLQEHVQNWPVVLILHQTGINSLALILHLSVHTES